MQTLGMVSRTRSACVFPSDIAEPPLPMLAAGKRCGLQRHKLCNFTMAVRS